MWEGKKGERGRRRGVTTESKNSRKLRTSWGNETENVF